MNLVLLEPSEVAPDGRVHLRDGRAQHVRDVLGAEGGDVVRAGIIEGPRGLLHLEELSSAGVVGRYESQEPASPRSGLHLLLCLPRPKQLQRLLSPIAQLGVDRVFLSGAYRVERFYFDAHILDPAEQRLHLLEGMSQARTTTLPRISLHRSFTWLLRTELDLEAPDALRLVGDLGPHRRLTEHRGVLAPSRPVVLAIGPEGGFTDRERRQLAEARFDFVTLGDVPYRTDVALIALLSRLRELREEGGP